MTPQEAIDVLKKNYPSKCFEDLREAVDIAIEALEDREQIFHLECLRCKKPVGSYSKQTMEQVSYTHYSYCEDCLRKGLKMLKKQDALDKQSASTEQVDYKAQVKVLADVLDGRPITEACEKLGEPADGWCEINNCRYKKYPSAKCWLEYARVMAESKTESDHIADSDKMVDQFRGITKKTDDVPDTNVGKTDFQPGDKFILELGAERKMFDEFEIAGTDLYVETRLLEKLTRYEPEEKTEKIPYKKPEIIRCTECKKSWYSGTATINGKSCRIFKCSVWERPVSPFGFCYMAERRNDG